MASGKGRKFNFSDRDRAAIVDGVDSESSTVPETEGEANESDWSCFHLQLSPPPVDQDEVEESLQAPVEVPAGAAAAVEDTSSQEDADDPVVRRRRRRPRPAKREFSLFVLLEDRG